MYFSMCVVFHVAVIKLRQCDQLREQLLKSSRRTTGVLREIPLNLYVFWLRRSGSSENSSNMSFTFSPFLRESLQRTVQLVRTVPSTERAAYVLVARINLQEGAHLAFPADLALPLIQVEQWIKSTV